MILESILSEEKEKNVQNSASIAKVMYKKQFYGSKLIIDLCRKIFNWEIPYGDLIHQLQTTKTKLAGESLYI